MVYNLPECHTMIHQHMYQIWTPTKKYRGKNKMGIEINKNYDTHLKFLKYCCSVSHFYIVIYSDIQAVIVTDNSFYACPMHVSRFHVQLDGQYEEEKIKGKKYFCISSQFDTPMLFIQNLCIYVYSYRSRCFMFLFVVGIYNLSITQNLDCTRKS